MTTPQPVPALTVAGCENAARARPVPALGLSPDDAAAALGVSRDSFERYVLGELRVVRVGRRVVVPVRELERFLERHAARPLEAELGGRR